MLTVTSNSYLKSTSGFLEKVQMQKSIYMNLIPISIYASWKQLLQMYLIAASMLNAFSVPQSQVTSPECIPLL